MNYLPTNRKYLVISFKKLKFHIRGEKAFLIGENVVLIYMWYNVRMAISRDNTRFIIIQLCPLQIFCNEIPTLIADIGGIIDELTASWR